MATINNIVMSGRVVRDPELKTITTKYGDMVNCRISIVTEDIYRQKDGSEKKEACFIDFTLWKEQAQHAAKYLKKGSPVTVSGTLKEEKWIDKATNQERKKHVIQPNDVMYLDNMPQYVAPEITEAPMPKAAARQATIVTNDMDDDGELPF